MRGEREKARFRKRKREKKRLRERERERERENVSYRNSLNLAYCVYPHCKKIINILKIAELILRQEIPLLKRIRFKNIRYF